MISRRASSGWSDYSSSHYSGMSRLCSLAVARTLSSGLSYFPELASAGSMALGSAATLRQSLQVPSATGMLRALSLCNLNCTGASPAGCAAQSELPDHSSQVLVLYADKNPVDQEVVSLLLASQAARQNPHNPAGFKVIGVGSGKAALDWVFTSKALPDIVLLDFMLPDINVTEVRSRLLDSSLFECQPKNTSV